MKFRIKNYELFHVKHSSAKLQVSPKRFLFAQFGLHVCLNQKMCAKTEKQFSIQPCAALSPMRA